jgi:hypothetical protein
MDMDMDDVVHGMVRTIIGGRLGAKGLGVVTGGILELHGSFSGTAWTRLSRTANAGDTSITVSDDVSYWEVGHMICIASTDFGYTINDTLLPLTEQHGYGEAWSWGSQ